MKKITAIIISVMIFFSVIGVSAAEVPSFMEDIYKSYSSEYKISLKLANADEITGFLKELDMPDEVNNYVDVKALLESVGSFDSVVNAEVEISEDFRKIKAGFVSESDHTVVINRNYNSSHHATTGVWVDFNADKRECRLIYSTPLNHRYAVIDVAKDFPKEISEKLFDMYDKLLTRENAEEYRKTYISLLCENADIVMNGSLCNIKIDNDDFIAIINGVIKKASEHISYINEITGEDLPIVEIPTLPNVKILGENGITMACRLLSNRIRNISESWDVSLSISDIYTAYSENEWPYEHSGDINFSIKSECAVKKINSTKVTIPELTEENSFSLAEERGWFDNYYETEEVYEEYHYLTNYICGEMDSEIIKDGRYYMPVRHCIEYRYEEYADISYNNGVVNITTDFGECDINVSFRVGEDSAVVNGVSYNGFGEFVKIGGTVYASAEFYEKCLGWELSNLTKDLLNGYFSYAFWAE